MSKKIIKYYINNQPVTINQFYQHQNTLENLGYISFNSYNITDREEVYIKHYNKAHEKTVVFKKKIAQQ